MVLHPILSMLQNSTSLPEYLTMRDPSGLSALHVVFHGRVQGVWFRGFTCRNAQELGVTGWVRNRLDGTVEAQMVGEGRQINELLRRCRKGPPAAKVEQAIGQPGPVPDPVPADFRQRDTM